MHARIGALLLALAVAACAAAPEPAPVIEGPLDLAALALEVRPAVEAVLGAPVPEAAAVPLEATRGELEADLVEDLRPQVERLHPEASALARETLLRVTARSSSVSVIARYSAARGRIFVAPENLLPQMEAAGLPTDPATARDFAAAVLAHEMVHAADDAAGGLASLFRDAPDAEAVRALGMVLEGRAVHYARLAAERLGLRPEAAAVLPGGRGPLDERRARFLLAYREGAAFAAALEARGGRALAARPLAHPPRLTSTLFHPERYGESGEEGVPDLVAALAASGFDGTAATSELDLRARWLPLLGEEATIRAFSGYRAGAGRDRPGGGVSVSVHGTEEAAAAYASALRTLHDGAPREGFHAVVVVEGRTVAGAVNPLAAAAELEARRALAATR